MRRALLLGVQGELQFCAERGVQAATLAGLIDNRSGATSRFWQEFQQCSRYVEWVDAELAVEKSCRWRGARGPAASERGKALSVA